MNKPLYKILLAEDDPNLGTLLLDFLGQAGFEIKLCNDGEAALKAFYSYHFDLCLLDVMMPKMDGFSLAKAIRRSDKNIPLIFITARSFKDDKLKGYDLGADDYITKPFDEEELLWKMRALLKRATKEIGKQHSTVSIGRYVFDHNAQSLSLDGNIKRITAKESEILTYLYEHKNTIVKRDEMLKALWGENDYFMGRSLDVFITKMRKYLKDDPAVQIENVFGVGFVFNVKSD